MIETKKQTGNPALEKLREFYVENIPPLFYKVIQGLERDTFELIEINLGDNFHHEEHPWRDYDLAKYVAFKNGTIVFLYETGNKWIKNVRGKMHLKRVLTLDDLLKESADVLEGIYKKLSS